MERVQLRKTKQELCPLLLVSKNCLILRSHLLRLILAKSSLEAQGVSVKKIKTAAQVLGQALRHVLTGSAFRIIERQVRTIVLRSRSWKAVQRF